MTQADFRQKIDLGGTFGFRTPGREYTPITVPSSYRCVGKAEFLKEFSFTPARNKTVLLTAEGINYEGRLTLNGKFLGTTLPYCHYSFDVTDVIGEQNTLQIEVEDLHAPYGLTDGWCCCGGIIRAIYLEILPAVYLKDFRFRTQFNGDFSTATVTISGDVSQKTDSCALRAELFLDGEKIATAKGAPEGFSFPVDSPRLWSPDSPTLYRLVVSLVRGDEILDVRESMVGFKSLVMDDRKFYLNGKPFFFVGVCRHDLAPGEKGQTMTDEEIESDLRMIKDLGANFVRLVHYPHDRRVIDAADRLGLLVSEESGLWWSDLTRQTLVEGALEVLRRTIIRDRNHVSVAFWMGFNECVFTQDFLNRSVEVCRRYDPDRYVSGANCMCPEMTVPMFAEADIDFYTFHPYGNNTNSVSAGTNSPKGRPVNIDEIFRAFQGKPLIFTEWGGWNVTDNPALFLRFCDRMKRAKEAGQLAGMLYWAFADMVELNRDDDACHDGVQIEGLVTMDRRPKVNYYAYREFISTLNKPAPRQESMTLHTHADASGHRTLPVALPCNDEVQKAAWEKALQDAIPMGGGFRNRCKRRFSKGPVLPRPLSHMESLNFNARQKPIVVNPAAPEYTATVTDGKCSRIWLLGNALFTAGYPVNGNYGEVCGALTLTYESGKTDVHPLRNGIELLTPFTTFGSSFIDPRSPRLIPAVDFSYNKNFENYRIYVLPISAEHEVALRSITLSVSGENCILLYGICTEEV